MFKNPYVVFLHHPVIIVVYNNLIWSSNNYEEEGGGVDSLRMMHSPPHTHFWDPEPKKVPRLVCYLFGRFFFCLHTCHHQSTYRESFVQTSSLVIQNNSKWIYRVTFDLSSVSHPDRYKKNFNCCCEKFVSLSSLKNFQKYNFSQLL